MKKVTNTWKEPIVLPLAVPGKPKERTTDQIIVGESMTINDDQISPEMKAMERKKKISIVAVEEPCPKCGPLALAAGKHDHGPDDEPNKPLEENGLPPEDDEIKRLENELLHSEPDPTEG